MNKNYTPKHNKFNKLAKEKLTNQSNEASFFSKKEQRNIYNQRKNKLIKIILIVLLIVFITTLAISFKEILKWNKDNKEIESIINNIHEEIKIVEIDDNDTTELVNSESKDINSDYLYYTKFSLIDVDISSL